MNAKYFPLYLMIAFAGLIFLAFDSFIGYRDLDPGRILLIALPDLAFFMLAYKTCPEGKEHSEPVR
ncbi:MAG TPA: hypothetical protein VHA56_18565 [Mucilaginibacter sp.]|nr:hypothetical protein [Mucilaginibacter sp.]